MKFSLTVKNAIDKRSHFAYNDSMESNGKKTDSIPRASILQMFQTLSLMASANDSIPFEQVRAFLQQKSERKAPGSSEAMWTTTRDVLSELQRLDLVTVGILPRKRSDVERLRNTPCQITDQGRQLASLYAERPGQAFDELLVAWMNEHPYFRTFMIRLLQQPLYVPDITSLKQLSADKQRPQDINSLTAVIAESCLSRLLKVGFSEEQATFLGHGIRKRVGQLQETLVLADLDGKKWIDAIEHSVVIPTFLEAENLPFDLVTFDHLMKVSRDFYSGAWTSTHPDFEGRIIFATCDFCPNLLVEEHIQVSEVVHHGPTFAVERFPASLMSAYRRLAGAGVGYVDAYAVRALVCVDLRIQPQVFAVCLRNMIAESASSHLAIYTELPFTSPPPGEDYIEVTRQRIGRLKLSFRNGG